MNAFDVLGTLLSATDQTMRNMEKVTISWINNLALGREKNKLIENQGFPNSFKIYAKRKQCGIMLY